MDNFRMIAHYIDPRTSGHRENSTRTFAQAQEEIEELTKQGFRVMAAVAGEMNREVAIVYLQRLGVQDGH